MNFELSHNSNQDLFPQVKERWLKWCGIRIDTTTLEVSVDYSRFLGKHVRDTIKIRSESSLERHTPALQSFTARKLHRIFLDADMNSYETRFRNLLIVNVLVAMKLHCYTRGLVKFPSCDDLEATIRTYSKFLCKLVGERSMMRSKFTVENLNWNCLVVMCRVLSFTKESRYHNLLSRLRREAENCSRSTSHRKAQLAFKSCEFELNYMMREIQYCLS